MIAKKVNSNNKLLKATGKTFEEGKRNFQKFEEQSMDISLFKETFYRS